jgi:hypothetical protein
MIDVGEYCRRVEDYLTRVNAGHLVRIVGPGFGLVREWAERSVPLSVVFRGIDNKAERHRHGKSTRPLRIEFCADDVRAVFDQWRRAVGLDLGALDTAEEAGTADGAPPAEAPAKSPALGRHLDRIIDKLARASGRDDLPAGCGMRPIAYCRPQRSCGNRRHAFAAKPKRKRWTSSPASRRRCGRRCARMRRLSGSPRCARTPSSTWRRSNRASTAGAWTRSIDITVDRLLRDRFALPHISL